MQEPDWPQTRTTEEEPGARKDFLSRGRLLLLGGVVAAELAIFFVGMVTPIDQATQQSLLQQANNLLNATGNPEPVRLLGMIFFNNVRVALVEMIPAFGALVFVISIFNTGLLIQALAISNGLPGALLGALLFLFPYSIVELLAYALAVGSGFMLLVSWRRKRLRREAKVFTLEAVAVVAILLVAAAMETVTIVSPGIGLALWLPTGLLIAWLVVMLRRRPP